MDATEAKRFFEQVASDWDTMPLAYYDERLIDTMADAPRRSAMRRSTRPARSYLCRALAETARSAALPVGPAGVLGWTPLVLGRCRPRCGLATASGLTEREDVAELTSSRWPLVRVAAAAPRDSGVAVMKSRGAPSRRRLVSAGAAGQPAEQPAEDAAGRVGGDGQM